MHGLLHLPNITASVGYGAESDQGYRLPCLLRRVSSEHDLPVCVCSVVQDTAKNMRFSINFFTSIGLGGLTDAMRDYLQNEMPRIAAERQAHAAAAAAAEASSSESDSSSDDDSSSSDSGSSDDSSSSGGSSRWEGWRGAPDLHPHRRHASMLIAAQTPAAELAG